MTRCPHIADTALWLDGEAGERAENIARHVLLCPVCKAHADTIRRFDFAAREAASRVKAPPALVERLNDLDAAQPVPSRAPLTRRRMFGGITAAASVAAVGSAALIHSTGSNDLPMAIFGDFATHIAADRKQDVSTTDVEALADWFRPKLPFTLPRLTSLSEFDLIGGRLCWFLDRRIAVFNFEHGGKALGLYLAEADGLTCLNKSLPAADKNPAIVSQDMLNGAFWRNKGLAHALAGEASADVIKEAIRILHPVTGLRTG